MTDIHENTEKIDGGDQERKLAAEILADARKKADRTHNRAQKDLDKARNRQAVELEQFEQKRMADAEKQAGDRVTSVLSRIEHEKMRRAIEVRERIIQRALSLVRSRFESLSPSEAHEVTAKWFVEAFEAVDCEQGTVWVHDAEPAENRLNPPPDGWTVEKGDCGTGSFGVVLESKDGVRRFDNTLAARLERFEEMLRFEVSKKLELDEVFATVRNTQGQGDG